MKKLFPILIVSSALLYSQGALAAIKCWTNSEGYRECGNAVPPEYAQQETRTLNKRGITTGVKQRAKSREELLQEQQMLSEKQKIEEEQRKIEEEKKRVQEEQVAKDRVLLSTFLKPEEIIAARDRKITVIDGYLELTQITLGNLNTKLEDEQKKVAKLERQGKKIPPAADVEIKSLRKQIKDKEQFLVQKGQEKQKLIDKYDADHVRFIELMKRKR